MTTLSITISTINHASFRERPRVDVPTSTRCEIPSAETSIDAKLFSTSSTALLKNFNSLLVATSSSDGDKIDKKR